jgi:perosamine synthetase
MSRPMHLDAPSVGALEKKYLNRAIDSGYVSSIGPFVGEFENSFARFLRAKNVVSTQSGTAALHIALTELGIGKGDEVIVPALTFIASVNPVTYVGAKPVFADVDSATWNIDPLEIEKRITKRTKAIIPVHLYGNPCDMDKILKIAKVNRLHVIEDSTESFGAVVGGKHTGTFGDFGCFSFNGNKVITTGGGGMLVCKSERSCDHVRFMINQAKDKTNPQYHPEIGFNYRMTNIEAALGLAQMDRIGQFLDKKMSFAGIYRQELADIPAIKFQQEILGAISSAWFTAITFADNFDVSDIKAHLEMKNIPTRRIFMPIVSFPPYKGNKSDYSRSFDIYERGLCLPSSTLNGEKDVYRVCVEIKRYIREH